MERKVSTLSLKIGMYVTGLDRPWLDTPFQAEGFVIHDDDAIDSLQKHCETVSIDTEKGIEAEIYLDEIEEVYQHYLDEFLENGKRQVEYHDQTTAFQEFPVAETALEEATAKVTLIMHCLMASSELDVQTVRQAVQPLLDSMIRNADAMLWMLQVQENRDYTYSHSTDNCVFAIAFGRHLGLYKEDLRLLAMGMLLLDIGKTKISPEILNKPGTLTKTEFATAQKHVDYGANILKQSPDISEVIIEMVATHHERHDGSGYPHGLSDIHIPMYGRIAGIIDCYSAMTSKTPYRDAIAQHTVLQGLEKWRGKYFHDALSAAFIQCLGEHPTGSLVEMTSGEVGMVVAQNADDPQKPTVMILLDEQKKESELSTMVDMTSQPTDSSGLELKILHALKPGAYGIEPSKGTAEK